MPKVPNAIPLPAGGLSEFLRYETTGGRLLLGATAVALLWANLAGDSYASVWSTDLAIGPQWLHLDLELSGWVADGLLAIFFFIAGLEVKRELTVGELAGWRAAALPLCAAAGGVVVPAAIAIAISGGAAADGGAWAVPVATDIAFALGVLAIAGAGLPSGVRVLLLSLAVVDDLIAIVLIAVLFTEGLAIGWLAAALAPLALFALACKRPGIRPWLLWILAVAVWICVNASGVHATVAGIALGLLVPVRGENPPGARFEHRLHPLSAGVIVPLFAIAAAGIPLAALGEAVSEPVAVGIFAGLLLGKPAGILLGARIAVAARVGELPAGVRWADFVPLAVLGGIGYTVSLLISRLAFTETAGAEQAAAAVLAASAIAAVAGVLLLRRRPAAADR